MEHASDTQVLRFYFNGWDLALRAVILAALSGACWLIGQTGGGSDLRADLLWVVGCPLFGLLALRYVIWNVSRKPAVVVTPEWIESSTLSGHVAIMWQEIAAMAPYKQSRQHYVAIFPEDREIFLSRLSAWRRFWVRIGTFATPAPFNIWTSALEVSPDAFWRQLVEYGRAYVPHVPLGVDEESSRAGDEEQQPVEATHTSASQKHDTPSRRARRVKSQRQIWIERLSIPAAVVLAMFIVFPAWLLMLDHPNLSVPLLAAAAAASVVFGLAALPRTRMRGLLAWCAFVSVLSAMSFAIVQGWGSVVQIIYGLISLLFFVVVVAFTARLNRRIQRISSRHPGEP